MRTQVAPGVWRDDGPQSAHVRYNQFAVQAVTVAAMVPVLTHGEAIPVTSGEYQRRHRRLTKAREERVRAELKGLSVKQQRPACGAAMRYGEACGRRPGHALAHRSRTIMDADIERRAAV